MTRYRIVATTRESARGYTLHLVRWITDSQAAELMRNSRRLAYQRIHNGTPVLVLYKERFNLQGFTVSREELNRLVCSDGALHV